MSSMNKKKVFIRSFGWPLVQVARDDIGVIGKVEGRIGELSGSIFLNKESKNAY